MYLYEIVSDLELLNVDHLLGTEYAIDSFNQPAILNNDKYGKETY